MWAALNGHSGHIYICVCMQKIIKEEVRNLKENERMREEWDWIWRGRNVNQ